MSFAKCLKKIIATVNESERLRNLGVMLDCAFFNEARNRADTYARFPCRLHSFGWTQSDGAGAWCPVYHFAIIGKMTRSEELDNDELDFHDVCEELGHGLHQQTIEGYAVVCTKGFIFDTGMTLTSDNRRIQVSLAKDEVGFGVFFWATNSAIETVAASATNPSVVPYDMTVWPTYAEGEEAGEETQTEMTSEQKAAIAGKQRTIGQQIF